MIYKLHVVIGYFVKNKNKKFRIDLKWPEMRSKVIFGHPSIRDRETALETETATHGSGT